jgi:hypothetical protein
MPTLAGMRDAGVMQPAEMVTGLAWLKQLQKQKAPLGQADLRHSRKYLA